MKTKLLNAYYWLTCQDKIIIGGRTYVGVKTAVGFHSTACNTLCAGANDEKLCHKLPECRAWYRRKKDNIHWVKK